MPGDVSALLGFVAESVQRNRILAVFTFQRFVPGMLERVRMRKRLCGRFEAATV